MVFHGSGQNPVPKLNWKLCARSPASSFHGLAKLMLTCPNGETHTPAMPLE